MFHLYLYVLSSCFNPHVTRFDVYVVETFEPPAQLLRMMTVVLGARPPMTHRLS